MKLRTRLVYCNNYYMRIGISITRNTLNWNVISITKNTLSWNVISITIL